MIYVDNLRPTTRTRRWKHDESCHLYADDVEELHRFAQRIGLLRRWFQDKPFFPHYDLTRGMRARAVSFGAKKHDGRQTVVWMRLRRKRESGSTSDDQPERGA